ncbi:4568_t:CDS:1, partial [Paraglomus occultum]
MTTITGTRSILLSGAYIVLQLKFVLTEQDDWNDSSNYSDNNIDHVFKILIIVCFGVIGLLVISPWIFLFCELKKLRRSDPPATNLESDNTPSTDGTQLSKSEARIEFVQSDASLQIPTVAHII